MHGQFVEEAKADIRADKTLSAPVVPRGHSCDSYLLQIHVVDVQVDFLVLVNTDIFGKRVDVFKGHFLRAENKISMRLQVSLLRRAPQIDIRHG